MTTSATVTKGEFSPRQTRMSICSFPGPLQPWPITHTDKGGPDPRPDRGQPRSEAVGARTQARRNRLYRNFSGTEIQCEADRVYEIGSRQYAIGVAAALPLV